MFATLKRITSLDGRGVECVVRKYSIGAIGTDEVTAGAFPSFSAGGYEAFTENERAEICQAVAKIFPRQENGSGNNKQQTDT